MICSSQPQERSKLPQGSILGGAQLPSEWTRRSTFWTRLIAMRAVDMHCKRFEENVFPLARREAQLQYQARASAQARQPTHHRPPENLLKLHEQVLAKSFARPDDARRAHGSGKTTFGPSPVVGAKEGSHWDNNFNDHPTRRTSNALMGNGGRFEGGNLDLRFLDDVY